MKLIPLLLVSLAVLACGEKIAKSVTVFDNGGDSEGVSTTIEEGSFANNAELAEKLSALVYVKHAGRKDRQIANRCVSGSGKQIDFFADLKDNDNLYLVAPGLHFVWPFKERGHRVEISEDIARSPSGSPIVLESIANVPRVFRLHNFFSLAEADGLIDNIEAITHPDYKLQPSSVGPRTERENRQYSEVRTSDNAFDTSSPAAQAIISRSFSLLRMKHDVDMQDGLQVVKYNISKLYKPHHDFFPTDADASFNWSPKKGGANRFATLFLYLSDVDEGGQTVFPMLDPLPDQNTTVPEDALVLFEEESWQQDMVKQCYQRLSVKPKKGDAVLFYSQLPNGEMDDNSLHGGCPPVSGTKYGANLWVWNDRRHGLPPKHGEEQKRSDDDSAAADDNSAAEDANVDTSGKIVATFKNTSPRELYLYYTDQLMKPIPANGGEVAYNTYPTHEWHVRDPINGNTVWSLTIDRERHTKDETFVIDSATVSAGGKDEL